MTGSRWSSPPIAAVLAAAALLWLVPGAAGAREVGARVDVQGVVTDAAGRPLADLQVVLEASRSYFSWRHLGRRQGDVRRISATTDERGQFALQWLWDPYFNTFELAVGVEVRRGERTELKVFERVDVTRRMERGDTVVAAPVVEDTRFLDSLRSFLDRLDTPDQRTAFETMGYPEEIKTVRYPDRTETTWWYFASGRAYRFRDGRLLGVDRFAPVTAFATEDDR